MEYWITNNDMNIWKVIQNDNIVKRTGRDHDGRITILPPTTVEEYIAVQRESKARTTLLQSILDDHVADFHYMDDARVIWNAVKARFGGCRRVCQLNQLKAKPDAEDINLKFLRDLSSSWSKVALTLKTKGGLEFLFFDDLYYMLKTLNVDVKGYNIFSSSKSAGPSHSAFVSATSTSKKMSYGESLNYSSTTTYSVPSNSKTRFAKTDSMKAMPTPLTGDYTSLSKHTDLDESQMSYGTKSATSSDSKSVSNDFVSCDDSDNSSKVNTIDFASSDSFLKSSEHKPTDSTSYVSTSVNEAEIESNVKTPIKEPISVHDLPSFTCNSSDKNEHTSRTSCNKNGSFNKKAGPAVRPQPIPTGKPKVKPIPTGKPKVPPVPTGKPQVTPVLTSKPHVSTPVPTGRPNRPFPVPTDRGYSPSETPFSATEDEGIFDSGCSRSMTDLFGATSIRSIDHKYYCLVITNDYSRFCWVFFLEHKDETYPILKNIINLVENQLNKKVKAIRSDNGTEFKNAHMIELCGSIRIKREYSNPKTPQQNRVTERKNKTLIEAARTMLADSKLPTIFWTEAVRTACYVLNIVSITSPHNKTPYALLTRNIPSVSHFKPFGFHVTILNTSDHLDKFDGKVDEGYIVGYSASNKAYRMYNMPNKRVEESMNLQFLKEKPNLSNLANPVPPGCIPVPTGKVPVPTGSFPVPTGSIPVPAAAVMAPTDDVLVHSSSSTDSIFDGEPTTRFPYASDLRNHDPSPGIFSSLSYDNEFDTALNNVASSVEVSLVAAKRINTIHPQSLIIGDPTSDVQMRSKEEMQQFKFQNEWVFVDFHAGKYAIGTKWILKNKRDARGIVVQNKARLVPQRHRQEEGIDYDEVFALVYKVVKALYGLHQALRAWYATLFTFLLKHGYKRGTINKTLFLKNNNRDIILVQVYVDDIIFGSTKKAWCDEFETLMKGEFQMIDMGELTFFLGLQVQQIPDGVFIHQDKYVHELLNKFNLGSVRMETTPYEAPKPKSKNESDSPVNVQLYRSMIGSLMYLTTSRPDIMFAVSACSRHQVTPTTSNLEAVKKIFKYLKGQLKLGLWYPKESPLVLEAYNDCDYAGENKDRKSTTDGCQFLGTLDTKSVVRLLA
nr:putative ribonuclease H-like domain-containing protein [Tanacetum cinerariifolium]